MNIVKDEPLEKTILASAILYDEALDEFGFRLDEKDFVNHNHKAIAKALKTCSQKGYIPDPVLIAGRLDNSGQNLLGELLSGIATSTNIKAQARTLREVTRAREITGKAYEIVAASNNIEDHKNFALDSLDGLTSFEDTHDANKLHHIKDFVKDADDRFLKTIEGNAEGIKTGIADIDNATNGFQKGEYVIFGGRPGIGKTAMGLSVAKNMLKDGYKVGVFSIEVDATRLIYRITSMLSTDSGHTVNYSVFRGITKASKEDIKSYFEARERLKETGFYINDSSRTTIDDLEMEVRRFIKTNDLDVVVVDHIGILKDRDNSKIPRHEKLQQMSVRLMGLFKEVDVLGIVLVQLKQESYNATPSLNSLSESGQFAKDASFIYLLHQPTDDKGKKILINCKGRDAEESDSVLAFSTATTEFSTMDKCDAYTYMDSLRGIEQPEQVMGF